MGEDKVADKVVYAYVVGDLWHVGHKRAMHQAKALGDYLIVGVLTDEAVWAYKRQPVIPFKQRMEIVEDCKAVDEVVEQTELDPTENLKKIQPDIIVHGDDWDENFPGAEYMRSIGKEAVLTKYDNEQSSSNIISKIRVRNWARRHTLMPKGAKLIKESKITV
jgi:rfaE bifunctional protein nucleotidyltransferase chain/domain